MHGAYNFSGCGMHETAVSNEKALKCKPSAPIFGCGRAKDACARQVHTLNEHVVYGKSKRRRPVYMAVVLVAATSSLLPYYSRELVTGC